uniref:Uncharacterized protein n=1 Tax=Oryza brachyantha TaxID=4533 RepID=J3N685_ORYBR
MLACRPFAVSLSTRLRKYYIYANCQARLSQAYGVSSEYKCGYCLGKTLSMRAWCVTVCPHG